MPRKTINTLAGFMVVSLMGILSLQAYWLKQTVDRSRAEFDQRANRALRASAVELAKLDIEDQLETQIDEILESLTWVDEMERDTTIQIISRKEKRWLINEDNQELIEIEKELKARDHLKGRRNMVVIESLKDGEGREKMELIRREGMEVIEQAMQSVIIREIKDNVSLSELLGSHDVGSVIHEKLSKEGIDIQFEYAVFEDSIVSKYSSTKDLEMTPYKTSLFPEDGVKAFLYLGFSTQDAFILKDSAEVLILVTLFSLLMIGTTIYAIRFMLQQKRLADMKTDFINNMTHEFKTPLATIGLAADSLRHPKLPGRKEEIDRYSNIISKESKRLNSHVESLLQLAKMERGELRLNKEEVDLIELVRSAIDDNKLLLEQSGAIVKTDLPEKDCRTSVDGYHFRNAISNLIDNAVKYSVDTPDILVSVNRENEVAEITITDKGRGMSEETRKRAFESFYREQSGNLHDVKGFGVGLSYVKKIVEGHDGSIVLHSKIGKGTTVTLKLTCV
jgi:two-component system phosphate regulon sensor histidine kinase PhoR